MRTQINNAYSLPINFKQIMELAKQCTMQEKIELARELEKDTLKIRFQKLLSKLKTNEITDEMIDAEVKAVRRLKYGKENTK
jgi:hypothetical protein